MAQVFQIRLFLLGREAAAQFGKRERQQEQGGQLRGEGLGGGDADFGAGARQIKQFGIAHHGRGADIADRQRMSGAGGRRGGGRGRRGGGGARGRGRRGQRI